MHESHVVPSEQLLHASRHSNELNIFNKYAYMHIKLMVAFV